MGSKNRLFGFDFGSGEDNVVAEKKFDEFREKSDRADALTSTATPSRWIICKNCLKVRLFLAINPPTTETWISKTADVDLEVRRARAQVQRPGPKVPDFRLACFFPQCMNEAPTWACKFHFFQELISVKLGSGCFLRLLWESLIRHAPDHSSCLTPKVTN